jgi:type VI protein secretion system component VasF
MANDLELQNLLSAVTDALLADQHTSIDSIVGRYAVQRHEVDSLVRLIRRLHLTLVGVQPSQRFVKRLRHDLVGSNRNLVARVRYLPPRVQIAAGIALLVGFILFNRRRLMDDSPSDQQEVPALQQ